jgi:CRISPR/Cas system-associated exonuclease Cas4 (RecB family)
MTEIPTIDVDLSRLIYDAYAANGVETPREHLGASIIGNECTRATWYEFRWADRQKFDGRMLRLFKSGNLQEPRLVADLQSIGLEVMEVDPDTGKQFSFDYGHIRGSCDGFVRGLPEDPKTWHILEIKTMNERSFSAIEAKGCKEAQPKYYAQMQIYMLAFKLSKALMAVVNKNSDYLYFERIPFDQDFAEKTLRSASLVVQSRKPPARVSDKPDFYKCKFCPFQATCHSGEPMKISCRTCKFASADVSPNHNGKWRCGKFDMFITTKEQLDACPSYEPITDNT